MTDLNLANTFLGIEFGSTRIKGVLIDENFNPVASGAYDWENRFENGYWTYSADDFIAGMQGCLWDSRDHYADYQTDYKIKTLDELYELLDRI